MKDRSVQYPNRYQLNKVAGTDNTYDLTPIPGEVDEEGTPINVNTLLKQNTAALYGLGVDALPDEAFSLIHKMLPKGIITMWSGAVTAIPEHWQLCNGTNGTPDLRDRFVVGAGSNYSVGNTGGANTVTLTTAQMPRHTHAAGTLVADTAGEHYHSYTSYKDTDSNSGTYPDSGWSYTSSEYTSTAGAHTHTISGSTAANGSGSAHENRPPYYALCYIMYMGLA